MKSCFCTLKTGCLCIAAYYIMAASLSFFRSLTNLTQVTSTTLGSSLGIVIVSAFYLILAAALSHGIHNKHRKLLVIWLVIQCLRIMIETGLLIFLIVECSLPEHLIGYNYVLSQKQQILGLNRNTLLTIYEMHVAIGIISLDIIIGILALYLIGRYQQTLPVAQSVLFVASQITQQMACDMESDRDFWRRQEERERTVREQHDIPIQNLV